MNYKSIIKFKNQHKEYIYLILIIILAFYLRTFNINWDNNYYFQPDERAIMMFTIPLKFPKNLVDLLNINSPLNPHFFAYGNFPLYLLKILSELAANINPIYKIYGGIHIIGRLLSAVADTFSVFVIFLITSNLFSKRAGLFASLLYAVSVYPIQASHFYAVDTLLTFFIVITIYLLIHLFEKITFRRILATGIFFGLALATKISALVIAIDILLVFFIKGFTKNKKVFVKNISYLVILIVTTTIIFFITQPYVFIDFSTFLKQIEIQTQMSNNAYIFPYTLQYVGKIPYEYEFKNIFLWGEGPIIALLNLIGLLSIIFILIKARIKNKKRKELLFLTFAVLSYFLIFGKFAVGWMRYMLPIYPLFSVFGGYLLSEVLIKKIPKQYLSNYFFRKIILVLFLIVLFIYPLSFIQIYTHKNTRIQASDWINKNIPIGSTIAVEHWDDSLPVYGQQNYRQLTLPLYDPDTPAKWQNISSILKTTDYIIIASNRLYVPLQKLTDCAILPQNRCYPQTAMYYKRLFSNQLGFKKVAEFTDYPTIPFTNIKIVDDSADESFTVYDHPKVMIFKKD